MTHTTQIKLAKTLQEFESAHRLLQRSREAWGFDPPETRDLWLLKQHALPTTITIIASQGEQVIGALSLFGDNPFLLPVETRLSLAAFRRNLEGRLGELSLPGLHPDFANDPNLLLGMLHFATCLASSHCHYDGVVMEATLPWGQQFAPALKLEKIFEPLEGRQLLFFNLRAGTKDYRTQMAKNFRVEYLFPEKKFFLVAQQCPTPEILDFLFNKKTLLFSSMSDGDLRIVRNVYDWGNYSKLFPQRPSPMADKKSQRYPRFPMSCEGFLVTETGGSEFVQLLDVSREGLKIRSNCAIKKGLSHVFTFFIGVNKKTEIIANAVWSDEASGISGLEICSADSSWDELLGYLEKEILLKTA